MKTLDDNTHEVHYYTRHIDFSGADPMPAEGYTHYVPDRAGCRWNHGKAVEVIVASGAVLKKDGTASSARTQVEYITPAHVLWDGSHPGYDHAPEWLLELFGLPVTP